MRNPLLINMKTSRLRPVGKYVCGSMVALSLLSFTEIFSARECLANVLNSATNQKKGKKKPPTASPELLIDKPLTTQADVDKLKNRNFKNIEKAIRKGTLQGNEDGIREWVRLRVYAMTLKTHRVGVTVVEDPKKRKKNQLEGVTIHKDRQRLMDVVRKSTFTMDDETLKLAMREFLCREIVKRCEDLLDNHLAVRIQAVTILTQLNILEKKALAGRKHAIAYAPAGLLLAKILEDPKQHIAVKLVAVSGMTRISRTGDVDYGMTVTISRRMGNAVLTELQKKKTHYKYQVRLAESLGALKIDLDLRNQPIYVDRLCRTMIDADRHPEVRSMAAEALGVAQYSPGNFNPQIRHLIVHEILRTTHEIAGNYNMAVVAAKKAAEKAEAEAEAEAATFAEAKAAFKATFIKELGQTNWKFGFLRVYFSFEGHPFLRKHLGNVGLAVRFPNEQFVDAALALTKPVVKHMVEKGGYYKDNAPQPIPKSMMDAIAKWIKDNPPKVDRLSVGLPPLRNANASTVDPVDQK